MMRVTGNTDRSGRYPVFAFEEDHPAGALLPKIQHAFLK
jgi:hypothetical protein